MIPAPVGNLSTTKNRILDAAEKLFGDKGFEATSLRDITAEAHVNLAAVNYHFQSKESLIDSVILRRMAPLTQRRLEMLDAAGPNPTLEQVIEAFISPLLEAPQLHSLNLIGRVFANREQFFVRVFPTQVLPVVRRFGEALAAVAPHLAPEERFWRMHFMVGTMSHLLAMWGVLPMMSGGLVQEIDPNALIPRLVNFLAAGFRAAETNMENLLKTSEAK
ncbi:MAG: TetR/AcrR family transcriptional regulator [Bryobacteraceae bacterium]